MGASLDRSDMDRIITKVLEEAGVSKQERLDLKAFTKCFAGEEDFTLEVDIPSDDEL